MFGFSLHRFPRAGAMVVAVLALVAGMLVFHSDFKPLPWDPLTPEERAWLKAHDGKIRLAPTPHWAPIEFVDDQGRYRGLVADYIRRIEKNLNFRFKIVQVDSWGQALEMAKRREIDIFPSAMNTPEREVFMDFSEPYLKLPYTIISRKNIRGPLSLEKMKGMTVAVGQSYSVIDYLKEEHPEIKIVPVYDELLGLKMVSFKEVDAMVASLPYALHGIETAQITNLRIVGTTDHVAYESIGTRNDWPILASIMAKGLAGISKEERQRIHAKWIRLEPNKFYYNKTFWYAIITVFSSIVLVVVLTLAWNRSLKVKVDRKTRELRFNERRLKALVALNEMQDAPIEQIVEFAFQQAVQLTGSRFGYLAFSYDRGDSFHAVFSCEADRFNAHSLDGSLETIGLWGDALAVGAPEVFNAEDNILERQVKWGIRLDRISRHMQIPVHDRDQVVALVGVGNKPTNYDKADARQLQLLMGGMWRIIQRRKAVKDLKASEQRFRDLVEFSLTGITILQRNKSVYFSPEYKRIFGPLVRIFENRGTENIHPDDGENFRQYYNGAIVGKQQAMDVSFRFFHHADAPNEMKWVYCRTHQINYQGKAATMVNVIDVTHIKKLENLLHVQDKMASLGHVTAGIAHEIRNPLSGINIYIKALENEYEEMGEENEEIQEIIDELTSSSGKIESVIRRVMDFSKPMEPRFVLTDISHAVREAVHLCRTTYRKSGITIEDDGVKPLLPDIHAEPHLIEEVVLNLINNAADALKAGEGEKRIRIATTLDREGDRLRDWIRISVADTGPGVTPEVRHRIFEPFFSSKTNSTGIGLSICQRIVSDHQGVLEVGTASLGGAEFTISLPVTPVEG